MDKTNVDVWEDLVIRACKRGGRSVDRVRGVLARRCGLKRECVTLDFIMRFLADIVDKYLPHEQPNDLASILADICPSEQWKYATSRETKLAPFKIEAATAFIFNKTEQERQAKIEATKDYLFGAITVLMSRIRMTKVKDFPGHSTPAWFRNAEKRKQMETTKVLTPSE